jgi:hypothetical protein
MAFNSLRQMLTPAVEENTIGGFDPEEEKVLNAIEAPARTDPPPEGWRFWESMPSDVDPRATVSYLDRLEGKQAPADVLPSFSYPAGRRESVPVVSAKTADVAAPIPAASSTGTTAIAPTTPSASKAPPSPAVETAGSGGDDEMASLRTRLGLLQAFEGVGSAASGKNLRTDGGILVDRMKQIEALRAKKLQTAEERALEASTWGASNRGTLASYIAQYKDRPEIVEALRAMEPAADSTKPGDFNRNIIGALTTRPKVEGVQATTKKTGAQTDVATATAAAVPKKVAVAEGTLAERERANKAREAIQRRALLVKQASDAKANSAVRAAGSDPKQAEKAITDAMKSAEKKDLGIVSNIRDFQGLEAVAPGFTQGKVPSWLGQGSIAAAIKVPGLNKQATQLASALELFTAGIRNSLFGASLTGNEKESFDAIVSSGVLMPPDVLAANINRIRQGAARFAQNHFTVAQELHPEVTGRVLGASSIFGPALGKGGIYSDVWTLPAGASAVSGAGPAVRPPKPADKSGAKTLWNKKRGTWVQYGPDAEAKARADNAVED